MSRLSERLGTITFYELAEALEVSHTLLGVYARSRGWDPMALTWKQARKIYNAARQRTPRKTDYGRVYAIRERLWFNWEPFPGSLYRRYLRPDERGYLRNYFR